MTIAEERSARKDPLSDAEVKDLLARVDAVTVAKGRKVERFKASEVDLDALKGPTGKYRAPMLLEGKTLLVGFNLEAAEALCGP
ncbi:MAG: hypothetical protein AAF481_10250 [Acidobacteriota bacterium]